MLRNTRKGFTLIELLIVVVIIGILAAIAIPKFANTKDKAKVSGMKTDLRNLVSAQEGHFSDYNTYATEATNAARSLTNVTFNASTGNQITIVDPSAGGWAATIERTDLTEDVKCYVFVGDATPAVAAPANTPEGSVYCQ